ncbi:MAG: hypothetical protein VR67_11805 [Peptococcaceae bacterium BRH_c8a]|nr:MAG: hypothetical protein VR67_11805 [Peptococcaceae bacterium BRH_c8a]
MERVVLLNKLLLALKNACNKNPLREKVLIVPSYGTGRMLCAGLARADGGWINLHPETTTGLAQQVAGEYLAEKNITLLTGPLAFTVIEEVFGELDEKGALTYFTRRGNSTGLVKAIASSIFAMRNCCIKSDKLNADSFVSTAKGCDMIALLKAYERYLDEHRYIDSPGLLTQALNILSDADFAPVSEALYLLPSFLQLYPLEEQVVKAMAGDNLLVLEADPVYGLNRPGAKSPDYADGSQSKPASETGRLPWLYSVDYSPEPVGDDSLSYFQAYGITNEVKEVLRRVLGEGMPLDNVTVGYTSGDYIPVFYSLAKRTGLDLTVEEGIPGTLTSPGRVLDGLIDWIKINFSSGILKDLLLSGDVRLPSEDDVFLSPLAASRLVRGCGIGWGRERYALLDNLAESLKERAELEVDADDGDGRREKILRKSEQARQLFKFISQMLNQLPLPGSDGKIAYREFTSSLSDILARITRIKEEIDAAALQGLVININQSGQLATLEITLDEALERVEKLLADFRVGASGPQPGCMHLTGYANLVWSNRPYTFIVGLDANTFPGNGRQDPVLLDEERLSIHPDLPPGTNRLGENQYYMALALASRRGKVVTSFSSFDVVENRAVYPSSVLLQIHRLLHRDSSLDYSHLINSLGRTSGYCPQDGKPYLDELEWWIGKALTGAVQGDGLVAVRDCYKNIDLGLAAMEARQSGEPTEYDGVIDVCGADLDPINNKELVLSCSRIEKLAGCPFAYFMRHVLYILPPDDIEYDPGHWLDALERGALLHQLFCDFMRRVTSAGEKLSLLKHKKMMMEMADELVLDLRKRIPPPGEVVFDQEVNDIYRCCELFLVGEEAEKDCTPVYFEVPFGMGRDAVVEAGCGLADPVEIKLADGNVFRLRGKIDRIDLNKDGTYSVWDYKTGGTYGYSDNQYLHRGRQVQHALYAIAAEQILSQAAPEDSHRVKISGYYFPTEKGEGQRVRRVRADHAKLSEALSYLFDLLAGGTFVAAEDGDKCMFCDYDLVCDQPGALARAKELVKGDSACLEPWRRLMEID